MDLTRPSPGRSTAILLAHALTAALSGAALAVWVAVGLLLFLRFSLEEGEHAHVRAELERRSAQDRGKR